MTKQEWVDDDTFNDLLALGNALPGPGFSQVRSRSVFRSIIPLIDHLWITARLCDLLLT